MKNLILISILFLSFVSFSQKITRGPDIGEIYFLGPTHTGTGLYYSTDFGETAVCMDSIIVNQAMAVTADKADGYVYYVTMGGSLYISDNFGYQNSWELINNNIYVYIKSGVIDGYIYNAIVSHSDDFGNSFIPHSYNGFYGNLISSEIDVEENIGYTIVNKTFVPDTIYLLITYDNFENLETKKTFNYNNGEFVYISRGVNNGELYLYNKVRKHICFSNDYGETFTLNNVLNFGDSISHSIVGGRQGGELFILVNAINMMGQNAHTYILHSVDYGISFELFHTFSKGQEPLLANFSAKTEGGESIKDIDSVYYVTGDMPLDVQFYSYSIGDINTYEWDFNNDGIVDSYEENPVYTYTDTGWYSINLTVYDNFDTNSFVREDYLYVYELTGIENEFCNNDNKIQCFPNPFSKQITFNLPYNLEPEINEMAIYNNAGTIVKIIKSKDQRIIWDGTNISGNKCLPGVYYITCKNRKYSSKVLLTS